MHAVEIFNCNQIFFLISPGKKKKKGKEELPADGQLVIVET